jgi:hypothetical protein
MLSRTIKMLFTAFVVMFFVLRIPVNAGSPFQTDDPFSLPLHTGEFYFFVVGTHADDGTGLDAAPGVEVDYSLIPNTFLHLIALLSLNRPSGGPLYYGRGNLEIGFSWHFPTQSDRLPEIAFFPILELPTGDEKRGLGSQKARVFLPVWLGKETESWTTSGGGGYWINPGDGNRNWWFLGLLIQRQLSSRFSLGGEVFHETPDAVGGSSSTGFNLGGGLTVTEPFELLFSIGRNIHDASGNRFSFYAGIHGTF